MFPAPPEPRRAVRKDIPRNLAIGIAAFLTLVITIPFFFSGSSASLRAVPYEPDAIPESMPFAIITDLDKRSHRTSDKKKPFWVASMKHGVLHYNAAKGSFRVEWVSDHEVQSKHSEEGRGMELSELVRYRNQMFTFDDRSGIVYELDNFDPRSSEDPAVFPRHILMEGDGRTDKGFKCEWATVKDDEMYVGSFGKEFTDPKGIRPPGFGNMWVKVIDKELRVRHEDWTNRFIAMRDAVGYGSPGYLLHETAIWNPFLNKWHFLPRRASKTEYSEAADEKMGTNLLISTGPAFDSFDYITVGTVTAERGFSSAKLVPGSKGRIIIALKSAESSLAGGEAVQTSFISIFTVDGKMLLEEEEITGGAKFEGIEFTT
ncbi:hypothetical protein FNF31_03088 [Cafeteria roenbergensis]|uniref:Apyrase n=1 Tax=Cafeteria roenbergensis TaxID=33653 RepID=A0A5A8DK54_CAFRO|nr:hypothetical protein FNF31_03088 [Cafeteria roenbergensis]KAA0165578.1 hypothetical protein FNF28_03430 [Cafeteria roenbergensis]